MRALLLVLLLTGAAAAEEAPLAKLQRRLAGAHAAKGPGVTDMYRSIVRDFDALKLPPDGPEAAVAAEAAFWVAEAGFREFSAAKFDTSAANSASAMQKALQKYAMQEQRAREGYAVVLSRYKVPSWQARATVRIGDVLDPFAKGLRAAPCPPDIRKSAGNEGCELFSRTLAEKTEPLDAQRLDAWEKGVQAAKELGLEAPEFASARTKLCEARPASPACAK